MPDPDFVEERFTGELLRASVLLVTFDAYRKGKLPLQIPDFARALTARTEGELIAISNTIAYLANRSYIRAKELRTISSGSSLWAVFDVLPAGVDAAEQYLARGMTPHASAMSQAATEVQLQPSHSETQLSINKVFVVHGRDGRFATAMSDFLRSLGLEVISWMDAVSLTGKATPYLNEVIEAALRVARAIVILMTPDNEARLRPGLWDQNTADAEKHYTLYPRQNVVYEAGMAFGLARDRTIIVKPRDVVLASDLEGLNYQSFSGDAESRNELASRLEIAGCPVKRSGDWLRSGDFPTYSDLRSNSSPILSRKTASSEGELTRRFSVQPTLILSVGGSISGPDGYFLTGEIANVGRGIARDVRVKLPELTEGRVAPHIVPNQKVSLRYRYDDRPCFTALLSDTNVVVEFEDELGTLYRQMGDVVQQISTGGSVFSYSIPTIGPPIPIEAREIGA